MTGTYTISFSGKAVIEKDPDAILDYPFDWNGGRTDDHTIWLKIKDR